MSDQAKSVNDVVADILQKSLGAVQDGAVWLQGQLPDVIRQFIVLHIAQCIFYMGVGLIFVGIGWLGYFKIKKLRTAYVKMREGYYSDTSGYTTGMVAFAIVFNFIGGMIILTNLFELITILVAPKIYLLEYVAGLMSNRR